MIDPLFWLGLSLLLVAISLTAVLIALIPAVLEISRAARSAEKLCDTLRREFPPTLEAIRLTGLEISELTDDIDRGVNRATGVVQQVDRNLETVRQQAKGVSVGSRSFVAGIKAAWQTLQRTPPRSRRERLNPLPLSFRSATERQRDSEGITRRATRAPSDRYPQNNED
ncbi:DUF948 domain-containing protein [Lusitaniella coriacea]|uniref:DUF948 domain-containing protein n=1 Tax=Lusitaniella coriacea TaxID=1983105 RepID=UPI002D21878A|nr:DUF948 domain-containing protein [Lusitaniella coriacea]